MERVEPLGVCFATDDPATSVGSYPLCHAITPVHVIHLLKTAIEMHIIISRRTLARITDQIHIVTAYPGIFVPGGPQNARSLAILRIRRLKATFHQEEIVILAKMMYENEAPACQSERDSFSLVIRFSILHIILNNSFMARRGFTSVFQ